MYIIYIKFRTNPKRISKEQVMEFFERILGENLEKKIHREAQNKCLED